MENRADISDSRQQRTEQLWREVYNKGNRVFLTRKIQQNRILPALCEKSDWKPSAGRAGSASVRERESVDGGRQQQIRSQQTQLLGRILLTLENREVCVCVYTV